MARLVTPSLGGGDDAAPIPVARIVSDDGWLAAAIAVSLDDWN